MRFTLYDRRAAVLLRPPLGLWPESRPFTTTRIWEATAPTSPPSACIAGSGVMNFTPTCGWYYIDANQKAPAWTGVQYL